MLFIVSLYQPNCWQLSLLFNKCKKKIISLHSFCTFISHKNQLKIAFVVNDSQFSSKMYHIIRYIILKSSKTQKMSNKFYGKIDVVKNWKSWKSQARKSNTLQKVQYFSKAVPWILITESCVPSLNLIASE